MAISNAETAKILQVIGCGKSPVTGGPATQLLSTISETMPYELTQSAVSPTSGIMSLFPIHLNINKKISNINFVSVAAESGGSHLWFALYDDGRSVSSSNSQLGLLSQTADQTGAAAFGANTNLGLSLLWPYVTTYDGIYYVGIMYVGSSLTLAGQSGRASTAAITLAANTGTFSSGTAGSGLTTNAPDPTGTITIANYTAYAYVS